MAVLSVPVLTVMGVPDLAAAYSILYPVMADPPLPGSNQVTVSSSSPGTTLVISGFPGSRAAYPEFPPQIPTILPGCTPLLTPTRTS